MSFSLCCTRPREKEFKRHGLQSEDEEEESRRSKNVSELRDEYRSSRERQRRNIQVLVYRAVSVELSDAISIIPINENLASPCGLNSTSPPALTSCSKDPTSSDPCLVPLGLHHLHSPRCSPSSSKTVSFQDLVDPPGCSSSDVDDHSTSRVDLIQSSEQKPDGSNNDTIIPSPSSSSTSSLQADLNENWPTGKHTCNSILKSSSSAWRGSRKFSAPSFRSTRQLSVRGLSQNQNFPFPVRKTRRISETVRRLGMYSSI